MAEPWPDTEQLRNTLRLGILAAPTEPEKAVFRCALNLVRGAEAYEIDPVTGTARTLAGYESAAQAWARQYARYNSDADADWERHGVAVEGRKVQADYAEVHPQVAVPLWFPDHGPATCTVCLMNANDAAGLPTETGLDPVTGRVSAPAEGAARSKAACFKVDGDQLKAALTHLVRIGGDAEHVTLTAGPGSVELSVEALIGQTRVQAASTVPATVAEPGRVALPLSVLRAAARKDPAAPLLVDAAATRTELGSTDLELTPPGPPEDSTDPRPLLTVPIRRFARAVATAERLADPNGDKVIVRNLWFALHRDVLNITGTDRYRLAQTSIPANVHPFAGLDDPARAFVPGAAAVAAAKMARSGTITIGADTEVLTLSAGPHQVRIRHTPGRHPDIEAMAGQTAARFAVRAGDLAELWGTARAEAKRITAEAAQVYRKSSGRISKPDLCLITMRLSRSAVTCIVEAPELRHYSGKKIKQIDDAHPGSLPGDYPTTSTVEIALTPWALDAVLRDADPDALLVLGLPADPTSRLLLVHTPGEVHVLARAHTRAERMAARYRRMVAELEASRAALAATAPKRKR